MKNKPTKTRSIRYQQASGASKMNFVDRDNKTKFVKETDVHVDGHYVGTRKMHTGNPNFLVTRERVTVSGSLEDKKGNTQVSSVQAWKEVVIFHPVRKFVNRTLNAIR